MGQQDEQQETMLGLARAVTKVTLSRLIEDLEEKLHRQRFYFEVIDEDWLETYLEDLKDLEGF